MCVCESDTDEQIKNKVMVTLVVINVRYRYTDKADVGERHSSSSKFTLSQ